MHHITRRTTALVVVALVALTACAGQSAEDPAGEPEQTTVATLPPLPDGEVTNITFWHGIGGKNGEALEALVAGFNAEYEGQIKVESIFQGSYTDVLAKYTAGVRDQSTPSVLLAGDIASGYLRDLGQSASPAEIAAAVPGGLELGDLRPAAANYYTIDGELFAVPFNTSTPLLWVNRDLLTKAGIAPDASLESLEDVAVVAEQILDATGKPGLVQPFDGWWFEQLTAGAGVAYCTPDNGRAEGGATGLQLTTPEQTEALTILTDLYTSGAGLDTGVDGNAALAAFTAGEVAMMLNSSGAAGAITTAAPTFQYEAHGYPISGDPKVSGPLIGGAALWLGDAGHSDAEKVAGWKFISYLTSAEVQQAFSATTGYGAINTAVDTLPAQIERLSGNPIAQLITDQLVGTPVSVATAGCHSGAMPGIRTAVVGQMQAAFSGAITLEAASIAAEQESTTAIKEYREQAGQ